MKKLTSLLLVMVLVFTSLMPAFAAEQEGSKINLKQAIEIAKEKLKIASEGFEFESSYSESKDGKKVWYLNWNSKKGEKKAISASIDADTGDIIYYYSFSPTYNTSKIPKYTREQALKAATEFATRLQPDKFKQTKLLETTWAGIHDYEYFSDSYNFSFIRYVNDVPCLDNRIDINVTKNSLAVTNYSFTWDNLSFTDPKEAITMDKAKKIFEEKLGLEASYQLIYSGNNNTPPSAILVYSLKDGNKPIDAVSGDIIPYYGYYPYYEMNMKRASGEKAKQEALTPQEQESVEENSSLLSKEKAIEALKKIIQIDEKYKLASSSLSNGYPKGANPVWQFSWDYNDETKKTYGYLGGSVDAVTGEITSLYMSGSEFEPDMSTAPKYSKEDAKILAEDFIKKVQPEKFSSTEYRNYNNEYEETTEKPTYYNFNYIRKSDGIVCPFNRINISVNAYSGQITNYALDWFDINLPKPENLISLEEAYKSLYSELDFSLKYIKKQEYWKETSSTPEIKLVYMLDNLTGLIDAKTGELLDYNGEPIKKFQKVTFSDIKGHWAEKEITLLSELGIIKQESDKFLPNEKIKQKDFVKLLIEANGPDYDIMSVSDDVYEKYYEKAIERKIIFAKEKNPDANITRLEAAKFLVRNLNLSYVADLKGAYAANFKDVKGADNRNLGYVSIVSGLNILNGSNGNFYPDRQLSRAEAAVIIVRLLKVDTTNKE